MKVVVIEDEIPAANRLIKLLRNLDESIDVVNRFDSVEASVKFFQTAPAIDLVFMDIQLADGLSFDIFSKATITAPVVFTTAFDQYTLKAFKVNSVDYLLKPVQKEDLKAALDKLKNLKQLYGGTNGSTALNVDSLVKELQQKLGPKEFRKRFLVKHAQKLVSVDVTDIAYFYSDGRLNFFKTSDNKKYVVDYTMDELESMLDPDKYFRISRSFYVSISAIDQIHDYFGNRLLLNLKPEVDKEAIISRERVTEFKNWMGK